MLYLCFVSIVYAINEKQIFNPKLEIFFVKISIAILGQVHLITMEFHLVRVFDVVV